MVRPRDKTVTAKACRMAQWVKAPAITLENLSYIPEICMKGRENWFPHMHVDQEQ